MTERNVKMDNVPDVSWLAKLSDPEYKKMKVRFADFMGFVFDRLLLESSKMILKMEDEEGAGDALAERVIRELVKEGYLPKSALKELKTDIVARLRGAQT